MQIWPLGSDEPLTFKDRVDAFLSALNAHAAALSARSEVTDELATLERMARAIRPAAFNLGAAPIWRMMAYRDAVNAMAATLAKPKKPEKPGDE